MTTTKLLDRLALAKLLELHKNTIDRMVSDGRLPVPLNIGTDARPSYRWASDVIQEWINNGCPRCNTAPEPAQ